MQFVKTAYFVIPENVKHGEELICSYFACRNAGIKFRYCSHCKVPVAKRNFRKRHKHGGEIVDDKDDDTGDEETLNKGIPSQITASREEEVDEDGISSQSADSTDHHEETKKDVLLRDGMVSSSVLVEAPTKVNTLMRHLEAPAAIPAISSERQARWMSLLAKRPSTKDSDTMSGWLMEVLAVSDLETPISNSGNGSTHVQSSKVEPCCNGEVSHKPKVEVAPYNEDALVEEPDDDAVKEVGNASTEKKDIVQPVEEVNGGLLKKKRSSDYLAVDDGGEHQKSNGVAKPGSFVSGSFAEWKERKKQKMQSKGITSPGNSGQSQSTSG